MNDAALIEKHGGPTALAKLMGLPVHGGQRRVQNWITRGIPARVKLAYPALFLGARASRKSSTRTL